MRAFDHKTLEIHVGGQGGGYGECSVIHLGYNNWIVIDSCINRETKAPLPLEILSQREVDLENVKLILCTHWHKDHISGLSTVLDNSPNAKFSFARAKDKDKFAAFIEFDYQNKVEFGNSSTKEFRDCLKSIKKSNSVIQATHDTVLYSYKNNDYKVRVTALSPSEKANNDYDLIISELLNKYSGSDISIQNRTPNDLSVVSLIECGEYSILHGADLEVSKDPNYGWLNIVRHSNIIPGVNKSSIFKIPHHGSENGFHKEIWSELLINHPDSIVTPYSKSDLPRQEYIDLYKRISNSLSITSEKQRSFKAKKRDAGVEQVLKKFTNNLREIRASFGLVSAYLSTESEEANWEFEHSGTAKFL